MKPEEYMALSHTSYSKLPTGNNPSTGLKWKISELLSSKLITDSDKPQAAALSSLSSYTLLNQRSLSSGFYGVAFQAPPNADGTPGEIVFAFRGTERTINDYFTDALLTVGFIPDQFIDANDFVQDVVNENTKDGKVPTYSFTGHSLGGGIAQYMTYVTAGTHKTVTFNAVGVGQTLGLIRADILRLLSVGSVRIYT